MKIQYHYLILDRVKPAYNEGAGLHNTDNLYYFIHNLVPLQHNLIQGEKYDSLKICFHKDVTF